MLSASVIGINGFAGQYSVKEFVEIEYMLYGAYKKVASDKKPRRLIESKLDHPLPLVKKDLTLKSIEK